MLAVLGAAMVVLAGCQKPAPKIGVLSGSTYRTVEPSTYCFSDGHCRPSSTIDLPVVTAAPDSKVLIDVPRQVEGGGWAVRAISLKERRVLGSSGKISDSHSYTVPSTTDRGRPFIVQVVGYTDGKPDSSRWSFLVQVAGQGNAGSV